MSTNLRPDERDRLVRIGARRIDGMLMQLGVDPSQSVDSDPVSADFPSRTTVATSIVGAVIDATVGQIIPNVTYGIYVPAAGARQHIRQGSGIVGVPVGDRVAVHYQDRPANSANLVTWADRLFHAASRKSTHAPTSSQASLPAADLITVGEYDARRETIAMIRMSMIPVILDWLQVPNEQFVREEIHRTDRRDPVFAS